MKNIILSAFTNEIEKISISAADLAVEKPKTNTAIPLQTMAKPNPNKTPQAKLLSGAPAKNKGIYG